MPPHAHERCQRQIGDGSQCNRKAVYNDLCDIHGAKEAQNRDETHSYRLVQAERQGLYQQFLKDDNLRSVRQEVAMCRMFLQELMNSLKGTDDVWVKLPMIEKIFNTLRQLTDSLNKTDVSFKNMIGRAEIGQLAARYLEVINDELSDLPDSADRRDRISARFREVLTELDKNLE